MWERAQHQDTGPKIAIVGPTGAYKTRTFLKAGHGENGKPRMLVLDYEAGTNFYDDEFCFSRHHIHQVMDLTDPSIKFTKDEIAALRADRFVYKPILDKGQVYGVDVARVTMLNRLAKNPLDFVLIDSLSMHYQWMLDKWMDIFFIRETKSSGHRRDYYTLQPRDWDKPNRDIQQFIYRLKSLNVGVFMTAHEKPEYAEGEVMKKIGMTGDVHKRLPYLMDTYIHIEDEEAGKAKTAENRHTKYVAIVKKDRTFTVGKRFMWHNDDDAGHSLSFCTMMAENLKWQGKITENLNGDIPMAIIPDEAPLPPESLPMADRKALLELKVLKVELSISAEQWAGIMKKRGVKSATELNGGQAHALRIKLLERINMPLRELIINPAFKDIAEGRNPFRDGNLDHYTGPSDK